MSLTWLIGKKSDVDMLWSAYDHEIISSPYISRNTNLFEDKKYKYIFNKKDYTYFRQKHATFSTDIVIKGIEKIDKTIMDEKYDKLIQVDFLSKSELFKLFCDIYKIQFGHSDLIIVNKVNSLEDLATLITLKKLAISNENWEIFLEKEKENWYQKLKQNTLISTSILNPSQIIPAMIYTINAKTKQRPALLFLKGKIKQGHTIWEFNKFWESVATQPA